MSSFGEAFLDVHADVSPFKREIEELKAVMAAQSTSLAVNVRQAGAAARAIANTTSTTTLTGDASGAIAAEEAARAAAKETADAEIADVARVASAETAANAERIAAAQAAAAAVTDISRAEADKQIADIARVTAAADAAAALAAGGRGAAPTGAPGENAQTEAARQAANAREAIRFAETQAYKEAARLETADRRTALAQQVADTKAASDAIKAIRDADTARIRADSDLTARILHDDIQNDLADQRNRATAERERVTAARDAAAAIAAANRQEADEIRRINQQTADSLNADLARQEAAQRAAADAARALDERNRRLYAEDQAFRIAAARAAEDAIQAAQRDTSNLIQSNVLEAKNAATSARRDLDDLIAARGRASFTDRATGSAPSRSDIAGAADQAAAAVARLADAQRAAGVAESDIDRISRGALNGIRDAVDDTTKRTNLLGEAFNNVTSAMGKLGITGQIRLIALAAAFLAPLAIIGAFTLAAGAAGAAVAVFGAKSADELRTARLNFESLGDSVNQAAARVRDLEDLASKGLTFANLEADSKTLGQLGINAKGAIDILGTLGDAFAKTGDVGAKLQTDIDNASVAIANLISSSGGVTLKNFSKDVENLKLPATAKQTFEELRTELNLTAKQLDDLISKGKISGAQVAAAAVTVAARGAGGSLTAAANESPTQAVTALRSSLKDALARAFDDANPSIAKGITGISAQLNSVISKFAPEVAAALPGILDKVSKALPAIGDALEKAFRIVPPILNEIVHLVERAATFTADFFDQANTKGSATQKILKDIRDVFEFIVTVIGDVATGFGAVLDVVGRVADKLTPIASAIKVIVESKAGERILEIAGALAAIGLTSVGVGKAVDAVASLGKLAFGPIIAAIQGAAGALGLLAGTAGAAGLAVDFLSVSLDSVILSLSILGAPFIAAALAVAAVVAAFVIAYEKVQAFHDAIDNIATFIKDVVVTAFNLLVIAVKAPFDFIVGLVQSIIAYAEAIGGFIGGLLEKIPGVTTAFSFVKDALDKVGEAFSAIGKYASKAFDAILNAIEAVLHALADAAGFGGVLNPFHGLADGANAAAHQIQLLRDNINGIPDAKTVTITVNADVSAAEANLAAVLNDANATAAQITAALDAVNSSGPAGNNFTGPISPTGRQASAERDLQAQQAAQAAADAAAALRKAGGTGGATSASSAASAIKTATATIDKAIKGFVTAVGGVQTQQDVTNAFKSLYDAITAYDDAIGKKEPKGLNAYVYKEEGAVRALVAQIVKINAAIAAASAEISSSLSFANIVSSSAAAATQDLSKLTIVGGTALTAIQKLGLGIVAATNGTAADNSFEAGLKAKLKALQDFAADIKAARAANLDPNLIADFLSAGPDSDAQLKAIIASGAAGVGAINATQQAINAAANALGDQAAKNSLATGAAVADGFIKGLQAQSKKLDAAATALGNEIAAAVKKSLGIKSPSRVAMGISNHFMDGLHIPLAGRVKETVALAEAHASAMSSAFDKAGADPTMRKRMIELTGVAGSDQKHAELMGALKDIHSATAGAPRTTIHAPVHVNAASAPAPVVADHVGRALARLR